MKTLSFLLAAALYGSLTTALTAELQSRPPVKVQFGPVKCVLYTDVQSQQGLETATNIFFSYGAVVLDAVLTDNLGTIWCKQAGGGAYTSGFHERTNVLSTLLNQKRATALELKTLLGKPDAREAPVDTYGTVLWLWRICNPEQRRLHATEILVGFKLPPESQPLFILTRDGTGNLDGPQ
jgi:hypothetical protein